MPAGKHTTLIIKREDALAEELDSSALHVDNVNRRRSRNCGYPVTGEYYAARAHGAVIAK